MSYPLCKSCGASAKTDRYAVVMPLPNLPEKAPLCEVCWAARRAREIAWREARDAGGTMGPFNKDRLKQAKTRATSPRVRRRAAS